MTVYVHVVNYKRRSPMGSVIERLKEQLNAEIDGYKLEAEEAVSEGECHLAGENYIAIDVFEYVLDLIADMEEEDAEDTTPNSIIG